ncbi:hypothetical protein [Gracilibacillus dipsosauri]|uniref:DUF4054 domain-containing protein n=1 Tax=Gracilibacillus dipsosauri TaxID=178340 RepID=A0A317KT06_9BACI|nr:hypothetical protein [Gracilibacillus dipsosauri]PWU66575.1 hypothetical protein DLJ74_19330 [Gracilibacillus dipsosauri]
MPYIDYDFYTNVYKGDTITQEEFDKLLPKASDVLDDLTNDYYQFKDLESDIPWRRDKFKKAVACQIEFFYEVGSTTSEGINDPQSVSIGRTTMSNGRSDSRNDNSSKNIVSNDVFMYLRTTGLLYRGLEVHC